ARSLPLRPWLFACCRQASRAALTSSRAGRRPDAKPEPDGAAEDAGGRGTGGGGDAGNVDDGDGGGGGGDGGGGRAAGAAEAGGGRRGPVPGWRARGTRFCLVGERRRGRRARHDPNALHERSLSMTADVAPASSGPAGNCAPLCI